MAGVSRQSQPEASVARRWVRIRGEPLVTPASLSSCDMAVQIRLAHCRFRPACLVPHTTRRTA